MSREAFDCVTCGACCFGRHDRYIALIPEDRFRAIPPEATTEIDGRRYMRMAGGHCASLQATADGRLVCGVYDQRPEACRGYRAGSFECGRARLHNGPLAAAARAVASGIVPDAHVVVVGGDPGAETVT